MKNRFFRRFSLILTVLLLLSGCSSEPNQIMKDSAEPAADTVWQTRESTDLSQTPVNTSEPPVETTKPVQHFEGELSELLEKRVRLTADQAAELDALARSIQVEYVDVELLPIEEQLARYRALSDYTSTGENLFADGPLTGELIYAITTANAETTTVPSNRLMPESDMRLVCPYIAEALNTYYEVYQLDPIRLSEKISALTLIDCDSFQNASYSPENDTLEIRMDDARNDPEMIRKLSFHECAHLAQATPRAGMELQNVEFRFGPGCRFPDAEINAIEWNWLTEGGAEMLARTFCGLAEPMHYTTYCKAFSEINLAMLPRADGQTALLENVSLAEDMDLLFDYFRCETEADKLDILNYMAMMDVKLQGASAKDFDKLYYDLNPDSTLSDTQRRERYALALGETTAKLFYRNLAERLAVQELTVEQTFAFMTGAESGLSAMTMFVDARSEQFGESFLGNYVRLQNALFDLLAEQCGISAEELYSAYDTYFRTATIDARILGLSEEETAAFASGEALFHDDRFRTAREVYRRRYADGT